MFWARIMERHRFTYKHKISYQSGLCTKYAKKKSIFGVNKWILVIYKYYGSVKFNSVKIFVFRNTIENYLFDVQF